LACQDTLWVLSDQIEVSFRAKVLSFAESPDLVREEWKVPLPPTPLGAKLPVLQIAGLYF